MPRKRINQIQSEFDDIYNFIEANPESILVDLVTSRGVVFACEAKMAGDQRRFISLPHGNRIYEGDWGYYFNSMGRDGQRIGQYSIPINKRYLASINT